MMYGIFGFIDNLSEITPKVPWRAVGHFNDSTGLLECMASITWETDGSFEIRQWFSKPLPKAGK